MLKGVMRLPVDFRRRIVIGSDHPRHFSDGNERVETLDFLLADLLNDGSSYRQTRHHDVADEKKDHGD